MISRHTRLERRPPRLHTEAQHACGTHLAPGPGLDAHGPVAAGAVARNSREPQPRELERRVPRRPRAQRRRIALDEAKLVAEVVVRVATAGRPLTPVAASPAYSRHRRSARRRGGDRALRREHERHRRAPRVQLRVLILVAATAPPLR
eukprot:6777671-Prymnesium_polylepis.1